MEGQKMLKNMQEVLEYGFEVFNKVYFNNELPPIVISIMSSPRTNGHFTCGKVWRAEETLMHEINISAEHLDRPIENIMATLQHEMIHYYCQLNGISDTSQYGRYHNKNFKKEAEARGLIITQAKGIGWSVTEPGESFIEVLREHGIEKPVDINRDGLRVDMLGILGILGKTGTDGNGNPIVGIPPKKPKQSTRKYVCPCCGNSFRATKDINVLCMDCNEQYIKEEK